MLVHMLWPQPATAAMLGRRMWQEDRRLKLIFHVGLHRAASTSVQAWLRSRAADWSRQRILVAAGLSGKAAQTPFAVLVGSTLRAAGPAAAAEYLLAELEGLAAEYDTIIISDENLLGPMPNGEGRFFTSEELLADVLARLAARHTVVPMLVLRDHQGWLTSLFNAQRLRGWPLPLSEFGAEAVKTLRFSSLVQTLHDAARCRPLVFWLDDIRQDGGRGLTADVARALGLKGDEAIALASRNAAAAEPVLRITAALGRRQATLAQAGGPLVADEVRRHAARGADGAQALADFIQPRAIRVSWSMTPSQRMKRAAALYALGVPPGKLLPLQKCLAAAREALSADRSADCEMPAAWHDIFAADRADLAERGYMPHSGGSPDAPN